jgi:Flp pilus assembly protein TadD
MVCAGLAQAAFIPVERAAERIRAGDLAAAEAELNAVIQSGIADGNAYNLMGLICSRTGRLDQAITYYQRALRLEPAMEAARNGLGAAYIEHGDLDEALKLFRAALEAAPNDVTAAFNIGAILAEQGRYADSVAGLESAHKLAPGDAVVSMWLARVHTAAGDMQRALDSLDAALGSMAKASRGHANAGLIAEALDVSTRLRAASPDARTLFLLAEAQFLAGKYDAAVESLAQMPEKERRPEYYRLLACHTLGAKTSRQRQIR